MKNNRKELMIKEALMFLETKDVLFHELNEGAQINIPHRGEIYSWYPTTGRILSGGKTAVIEGGNPSKAYDFIEKNLIPERSALCL